MLLYFLVVAPLWMLSGLVRAEVWPSFSDEMIYAIRSQRDLMQNISIDQVPLPGLALKNSLPGSITSNETESLTTILSLLHHGIQSFRVDLTFNSSAGEWFLEGTNIRFVKMLNTVNLFVMATNTNLDANILTILLRFDNDTLRNSNAIKEANFTAILEEGLSPGYVYSIADLERDRELNQTLSINGYSDTGWVGLSRFLFDVKKRVVFGFLNGAELFSEDDQDNLVFPPETFHYVTANNITCPLNTVEDIMRVSQIQWRFLEGNFSYENYLHYLECGYSLILTNPIDTRNDSSQGTSLQRHLSSLLLWSWNATAPDDKLDESEDSDDSESSSTSQYVAYRCGAFSYNDYEDLDPFKIGNCYRNLPYLCRFSDRAYFWNISEDTGTYFESDDKDMCPTGYKFGVPRTPLQQRSLRIHLNDMDIDNLDFWIDINSISVSNCWITGGPYASCPYQKYGSRRNYIAMTVPTSAIALVLLLVIFYFNWVHVPIQDNRNNWKRIINAYSKEEVEGVPS
ncbi:Mtc6p [Kluyveromyces lactis]|uniref:Maintenance of telomere capping protein 6 n=1 Tax=Kluyveromyces lactis (strain ATCC 8585 / CBS 2359 / DSM 70799 / NBRC 1267 / NRRL Y-1140 / WM37) TaxID=284590 RepID=MTC6_KLULA|nr:uncharacterized protein KLLA0_E15819g [Kluyveromyces lactis]Q6CN26.1 RecName: Full=Maintenance of telomere capping protein 6; Flags: Precursor [Kluyveromyces lactis NRRL Y-1140]CAG99750.1 KLLA0E15819p [Kluyveromyces lactis]|eukprot:XP_454663.1 uncharacterized protein KLLA0_E15819g [Kluyveromyces lactis]